MTDDIPEGIDARPLEGIRDRGLEGEWIERAEAALAEIAGEMNPLVFEARREKIRTLTYQTLAWAVWWRAYTGELVAQKPMIQGDPGMQAAFDNFWETLEGVRRQILNDSGRIEAETGAEHGAAVSAPVRVLRKHCIRLLQWPEREQED
jgi:hypothetical protein